MRRPDARLPAAVVALVALAVAAALLVSRSARLVEATGTGADPATALNVVPPATVVADAPIVWRPDAADTGRRMEPATRRDLGDDLLRGWAQLAAASRTGSPDGLSTYLTGPALEGVLPALADSGVDQMRVAGVELHLRFYSADGQVVALEEVATVERRLAAGGLLLPETRIETADLVLVLRDGTWRVHHRVLRDVAAP